MGGLSAAARLPASQRVQAGRSAYSLCQFHECLDAVERRQVAHVHLVIVVGLRVVALVGRLVNYLRVDGHHRVARVHAKRGHRAGNGRRDLATTGNRQGQQEEGDRDGGELRDGRWRVAGGTRRDQMKTRRRTNPLYGTYGGDGKTVCTRKGFTSGS